MTFPIESLHQQIESEFRVKFNNLPEVNETDFFISKLTIIETAIMIGLPNYATLKYGPLNKRYVTGGEIIGFNM